jgi:ABC-2 type transport system permease protein
VGVPVARQLGLALLTAALAVPAGWAATVGRGVLAGIGATLALVVVAAVAGLSGVGAWFPFAAPGIWATSASTELFESASPVQLALVLPVSAAFGLLTVRSWRRLQLDR